MKLKRKTYTCSSSKGWNTIQTEFKTWRLISSNWSVPIIHYVIFCEISQSADWFWLSATTGNQCKYLKNKMSWSIFQHYMNYNYIRDWHGFYNPSWEQYKWAGDLSVTLVSFTRYRSPLVTTILKSPLIMGFNTKLLVALNQPINVQINVQMLYIIQVVLLWPLWNYSFSFVIPTKIIRQ